MKELSKVKDFIEGIDSLIHLSGNPFSGKTTLCWQLVADYIVDKKNVFMISLEAHPDFDNKLYNYLEKKDIDNAGELMSNHLTIFKLDWDVAVRDIVESIKIWKENKKNGMIIIDHLSLLKTDNVYFNTPNFNNIKNQFIKEIIDTNIKMILVHYTPFGNISLKKQIEPMIKKEIFMRESGAKNKIKALEGYIDLHKNKDIEELSIYLMSVHDTRIDEIIVKDHSNKIKDMF